jgi:hypothetical protein
MNQATESRPCSKARYETRAAAQSARDHQARRRGGTNLRVYRCPDCDGFHLTSQRTTGVGK